MAPINKSGLAVVNYTYSGDSLVHTRLYYQDSEGNICEKRLNNTSDRAQNVDKVLGKARSHTEIVAVAWLGHVCARIWNEHLATAPKFTYRLGYTTLMKTINLWRYVIHLIK